MARIEAEARSQARLAWVGSEEAFNAAWPQLWEQHQIDRAAQALKDGQTVARAAAHRAF